MKGSRWILWQTWIVNCKGVFRHKVKRKFDHWICAVHVYSSVTDISTQHTMCMEVWSQNSAVLLVISLQFLSLFPLVYLCSLRRFLKLGDPGIRQLFCVAETFSCADMSLPQFAPLKFASPRVFLLILEAIVRPRIHSKQTLKPNIGENSHILCTHSQESWGSWSFI